MRIGPFDLTWGKKAADLVTHLADPRGTWWPVLRESFTGAWQRNVVVDRQEVLTYGAVWSCCTLIAADISKLWVKLVEQDGNGICTATENSAYSPVLTKPNHFMTRVKFFEFWVLSVLTTGATFVLKERNHRGGENQGNVTALYILDPSRVQVLVSPDGSVFYSLGADLLAGVPSIVVPAREIIHHVGVPLYHPLIGATPIHACGLAAMQGLKIQQTSAKFFANGAQPSGILTAPGAISNETAKRLEDHWQAEYAGEENTGKIVALGDGLTYTPLVMTARDAQLIDQLKWTAENVCQCFHVPLYMVGIGPAPPYTDIQSLSLQYYNQALQQLIENIEILLTEGLELPPKYGIEFDLDALLRMDTKSQMTVAAAGVSGGIYSPNEARAKFDLKPKAGGDTPYLQGQNYSIAALAKRDAGDPFAVTAPERITGPAPVPVDTAPGDKAKPTAPAPPPPPPKPKKAIEDEDLALDATDIGSLFKKELLAA